MIFTDKSYGLNPLLKHIVSRERIPSNPGYSDQIIDLVPADGINQLPMLRLPSLFNGLCQRFLDTQDDVSMIAAEQLVDGMDLDEGWCDRNLHLLNASPEVLNLAVRLIEGKSSRVDDFSEGAVTCFVANREEVERLRRIPGYE